MKLAINLLPKAPKKPNLLDRAKEFGSAVTTKLRNVFKKDILEVTQEPILTNEVEIQEPVQDNIVDFHEFKNQKIAAAEEYEEELADLRNRIDILESMMHDETILITDISGVYADFIGYDESDILRGESHTQYVSDTLEHEDMSQASNVIDFVAYKKTKTIQSPLVEESANSERDRWKILQSLIYLSPVIVPPLVKEELQIMLDRNFTDVNLKKTDAYPNYQV